jgi:hypothetical protein
MFPVIIDQPGPLPITVSGKWPSSNTIVVAVAGSGYTRSPNTMMGIKATLGDGTVVGSLSHFANPASTHLTFPTGFHAIQAGYLDFTLTLSASTDTVTDLNDHFVVSFLY